MRQLLKRVSKVKKITKFRLVGERMARNPLGRVKSLRNQIYWGKNHRVAKAFRTPHRRNLILKMDEALACRMFSSLLNSVPGMHEFDSF